MVNAAWLRFPKGTLTRQALKQVENVLYVTYIATKAHTSEHAGRERLPEAQIDAQLKIMSSN